jgi:hypothetical protein
MTGTEAGVAVADTGGDGTHAIWLTPCRAPIGTWRSCEPSAFITNRSTQHPSA